MRLSAQGSSCTSSCMAIINTSSECKGKCVLTVWDNQCLSEGCIIEALWKYTALAIDVSKWLLMCKDMSFEIESIPMHYYFSMQPNLNFNIMREIFFLSNTMLKKINVVGLFIFLTNICNAVNCTLHICIYRPMEGDILFLSPASKLLYTNHYEIFQTPHMDILFTSHLSINQVFRGPPLSECESEWKM